MKNERDVNLGKRLKECIKKAGFPTEKAFAETAGYTSVHLSRMVSGSQRISDQMAERFAEILGCRKEYLLGIDNFRTNEEMLSFIDEKDKKDFSIVLNYLNSIGFKCTPCITCHMPINEIYRNSNNVQDHIYDTCLEHLREEYDFLLPNKEFTAKYFGVREPVYLKDLDFAEKRIDLESISISDPVKKYYIHVQCSDGFPTNLEIVVLFKVLYGDKEALWDFKNLKNFVNDLREFSHFCILRNMRNNTIIAW